MESDAETPKTTEDGLNNISVRVLGKLSSCFNDAEPPTTTADCLNKIPKDGTQSNDGDGGSCSSREVIGSVHDNQETGSPISSDTDAVSEKPKAMIDCSNLIPSLEKVVVEASTSFTSDLMLERYLQCLESTIFTGVPFPCDVLFKDPLSSKLDVLSHIPEPFLDYLRQWTKEKLSLSPHARVVAWSFIHFLDPQCPRTEHFVNISDVTLFAALTLSLRSNPLCLVVELPLIWNRHLYYQEKGVDPIPLMIWMVNQASQFSVHAGMKSWVHNLLPLLRQKTHQWSDLILDIVEKILTKLGSMKKLVGCPYWKDRFVIPSNSLKTMLRVRFPASDEKDTTTRRFVEIYHSLKEVTLAGTELRADLSQQLFTECLRLAGEENPGLAREAISIAIWYLRTVL